MEIRYENFPADADEALVRRVFETYGDERFLALVRMASWFQTQEAASALAALENGSYVMDGAKGVRVMGDVGGRLEVERD